MNLFVLNNGSYLMDTLIHQMTLHQVEYTLINDYQDVPRGSILIGMYDFFDYSYEREVTKYCHQSIPYIRANMLLDQAFIGPVLDQDSACIDCLYHSLVANNHDSPMIYMRNIPYLGEIDDTVLLPWPSYFTDYICRQVMDAIEEIQTTGKCSFSNRVIECKHEPFDLINHYMDKDEQCSTCSTLPDDNPELAMIKLTGGKKLSPTKHRLREAPNSSVLKRLLVDKDTGKLKHIYKEIESKFIPMLGTESFGKKGNLDHAFGRSYDYHSSEQFALLESLERYSNINNKKSVSHIYGSYNQLKDKAVNPRRLGPHAKEQVSYKGYEYPEYHDDLEYYWVWGWSMKENKEVLVPEQMVYYGDNLIREGTTRFVYETSNGCALGSSLDEAMLYGLFEMIERDNFLVSWYNKLELVEIDVEKSNLKDVLQMKLFLEDKGYRLHFFDMSMELKVPSIWGMVIDSKRNAIVKTYSAAGAHFNPENALRGAMIEVVSSLPVYEKIFLDSDLQERRDLMYYNSDETTKFEDHVLLYSHPEILERFDFLFNGKGGKASLQELFPEWYKEKKFHHDDLKDDIDCLLRKVFHYYDDIYVVNLTGELLKKTNLACVKVFVPGMLTMSFGHQYRRIILDRVLQGPVLAGRRTKPIEVEHMNPFPHPFP
ncbi:TOMM precursor leader peptide-binding protein [Caldalkalibacillus mannanilyticus]|uniref:TOMM precursor leader peptide-binding protein n=1 Tax=Caldalkalibacillus mannanilyticus TaxID=1418 RepID=UPI0004683BF4|nr:TOMM precursor leader peptide-binding protein [Caldalkalibacillus mannanilyticus]